MTAEQEIQDNVFKQVYIPRTLQELSLEEIEKLKRQGNGEELYGKLTGLGEGEMAKEEEPTAPESPEAESSEEEDSEESEEGKQQTVSLRGMTKEQKKEHKKKVKEENREKRKTKIPKHIKKKAEKKNKK